MTSENKRNKTGEKTTTILNKSAKREQDTTQQSKIKTLQEPRVISSAVPWFVSCFPPDRYLLECARIATRNKTTKRASFSRFSLRFCSFLPRILVSSFGIASSFRSALPPRSILIKSSQFSLLTPCAEVSRGHVVDVFFARERIAVHALSGWLRGDCQECVLSYLVLSCFVSSRLVSSCLVLSCLVLSCLVLSCLVSSCLVLSRLVSSRLGSSRLALPCLVLPCLVLSCPALPCLVLSCPALPCLALPCLASPFFALLCDVLSCLVPFVCLISHTACLFACCSNVDARCRRMPHLSRHSPLCRRCFSTIPRLFFSSLWLKLFPPFHDQITSPQPSPSFCNHFHLSATVPAFPQPFLQFCNHALTVSQPCSPFRNHFEAHML